MGNMEQIAQERVKKKKARRRVLKIASALLLLAIACTAGGSVYMLNFALKPDSSIAKKNATTYTDLFANYPFVRPWLDSLRQEGALKDTVVVNRQGKRLHAYYAEASTPTRQTAVVVHGYTDNAPRMFMIGHLYHHELGFNILLPELQHHGESQGEAIQMGWNDRCDLLQWMDVANDLFGGQTQMVVHGLSMGAATVMMASGEPQKEYVKGFVEDCGYTSVWDEFAHELQTLYGLPPFPLLHTTSLLCQLKYGWTFQEASALKQVAACQLPMLFIHGDRDDFVPTYMVYQLYKAKPRPKELWVVPGAAHAMSYKTKRKEYTRRIKNFTEKILNNSANERQIIPQQTKKGL